METHHLIPHRVRVTPSNSPYSCKIKRIKVLVVIRNLLLGNFVRQILIILSIIFSFTVNSCSVTEEESTTETTVPTVLSNYPADSASSVAPNTSLTVTLSKAMDTTTITTNTDNTTCYGSLQVSSDSFSTCVQMDTSPSATDSNKTFTLDPDSNLSYNTTYKVKVTTDAKDSAGNALASAYTHSTGFSTPSTQQLGTSSSETTRGVATDSSANVYVTGYTEGGLDGNTSAGSADIFVLKYNSSGTKQWTNQIGTAGNDIAY